MMNKVTVSIPVYWAKTGPNSYWPARPCSEKELIDWANRELGPGKTFKPTKKGFVRVTFFGSYDHQYLPDSSLLPFEANLTKYRCNNKTERFRLAIEEAEGMALRNKQDLHYDPHCVICGGSEGDPSCTLVCDRCHRDVHFKCEGITELFEEDYYCPECRKTAPLTMKLAPEAFHKKREQGKYKKGIIKASKVNKNAFSDKYIKVIPKVQVVEPEKNAKKKRKMNNGGKRRKSKKAKVGVPNASSKLKMEEICFLCKRSGDGHSLGFVLCDFPNCTKVYHFGCLGNVAPKLKLSMRSKIIVMSNEEVSSDIPRIVCSGDDKWVCPWHFCGVCGEMEEIDVTSLPREIPSPKLLEAYTFDVERVANRKSLMVSDKRAEFIRCVECPYTLCPKHGNSVRPAYSENESKLRLPKAVFHTIHPTNSFRCLHCSGSILCSTSQGKAVLDVPPQVTFSKFLFRVWSMMMNDYYILFEPFLSVPSEKVLHRYCKDPDIRIQLLNVNTNNKMVRCMSDIATKIFRLSYKSLASFEKDIDEALNHIKSCYGASYIQIIDAAATFRNILSQKIAAQKKKFAVRKLESFIKGSNEYFNEPLFNLFPSLNMMSSTNQVYDGDLDIWASKLGQDILIRNSVKAKMSKKTKKVDSLVRAFKVLSNQNSTEDAIAVENATSGTEIIRRLEEQEFAARQLFEGFKQLKHTIEENQQIVSGLKYNEKPISLDDLSLVAEFRLANKNLKAQVDHLTFQLMMEKNRRKEIEGQLNRLKDILKH